MLLESPKFKIRNLQMNVLALKLKTNRVVNIKLKIHQENEFEKCLHRNTNYISLEMENSLNSQLITKNLIKRLYVQLST